MHGMLTVCLSSFVQKVFFTTVFCSQLTMDIKYSCVAQFACKFCVCYMYKFLVLLLLYTSFKIVLKSTSKSLFHLRFSVATLTTLELYCAKDDSVANTHLSTFRINEMKQVVGKYLNPLSLCCR